MKDFGFKEILLLVLSSLSGYVFYDHIQLSSDFNSLKEKVEQNSSELDDIWGKYNNNIEKQFVMLEKFMTFKEEEATKREQIREELLEFKVLYYKEKSEI